MAAALRGFAALTRYATNATESIRYLCSSPFFHVGATACAGTCEKPGVAECGGYASAAPTFFFFSSLRFFSKALIYASLVEGTNANATGHILSKLAGKKPLRLNRVLRMLSVTPIIHDRTCGLGCCLA
ncbi:hypothetical protein CI102_3845 [Trichoderma harzianum]|nr:hypothetical protein CI102_3845 [Trichoderma harzianum]